MHNRQAMEATHKTPIYHITHVNNLRAIVEAGALLSDDQMRADDDHVAIGYRHIKARRMSLPVSCAPGTTVGQYVPFYFCPRSIMLYIAHKRHDELDYRQGQEPIVHLASSIGAARAQNRPHVFTTSNAGAHLTDFYTDWKDLDKIDWNAVRSRDWHDCKEAKQAEFLMYERFDWTAIQQIGVYGLDIKRQVDDILVQAVHRPGVWTKREWYY